MKRASAERSKAMATRCKPPRRARRIAVRRGGWALAVALTCLHGCGPPAQGRVLTTIGQIRDLRPGDAEHGYPVQLRGVTTYYHASSNSLIVQTGDGGVLVDTSKIQEPIARGREVAIDGI